MGRPNRSNPKIQHRAAELRHDTTSAEKELWSHLRSHRLAGYGFRRQHAIGHYIVDFCAPGSKLVVELDGSQHLQQVEHDAQRTAFLESKGYRVLRFGNGDVMNNLEGVLDRIWEAIKVKG